MFFGWRSQVHHLDGVRRVAAFEMAGLVKRSPMPPRTKPLAKKRATPRRKVKRAKTAGQLRKEATIAWGRYIHARDVFCQFCGKAGGKLDAHHLVPRERNATRTDENNGVLLCAYPCHKTYMHGDPFLAVQFYTRRLGVEGYQALRDKAYDGINSKYPVSYWRDECARLSALLEALT